MQFGYRAKCNLGRRLIEKVYVLNYNKLMEEKHYESMHI